MPWVPAQLWEYMVLARLHDYVTNPQAKKTWTFRDGKHFLTLVTTQLCWGPTLWHDVTTLDFLGGRPGNFPVNTQRHMRGGKWGFTPHPSEHSFAMFLKEGERDRLFLNWKMKRKEIPNFIRIFGSSDVIMQALFCETSLPFHPKWKHKGSLSLLLGSKVISSLWKCQIKFFCGSGIGSLAHSV